jgi:hypothetical protein
MVSTTILEPGEAPRIPERTSSAVFSCMSSWVITTWPHRGDLGRGLGARGGAAHDLHAPAGGEDGQALPEHGVVVCEVRAYGHIRLSFRMNKVHARSSHGGRPRLSTGQSPHFTRIT